MVGEALLLLLLLLEHSGSYAAAQGCGLEDALVASASNADALPDLRGQLRDCCGEALNDARMAEDAREHRFCKAALQMRVVIVVSQQKLCAKTGRADSGNAGKSEA